MQKRIINIGILAHVDAGKTTLTENILFNAGAIRTKGSVDSGSTVSDSLEVERKRGISVRSATTSFEWEGIQINLIDTPGHADFTAEVERCLSILDGAILLISAVEGVQSHTYNLWEALKAMNIPIFIVVNKLDRQGADFINVLEEIESELQIVPFVMQTPVNEGEDDATYVSIWSDNNLLCDASGIKNQSIENLAELDELLLERYLDGDIPENNELLSLMRNYFLNRYLSPVFITVSKNDIGTKELLDAIIKYFPSSKGNNESEFSAFVYKIEHDDKLGRLAHIRVFDGVVKSRQLINNNTHKSEVKVSQIKKVYTKRMQDVSDLSAGDVGILTGLSNVKVGDVFGNPDKIPNQTIVQHPVLTVQVKPKNEDQYASLVKALQILNIEDPILDLLIFIDERELHLKLMGIIQLEIIQNILLERFGIECEISEPTIIYKETPLVEAEGYAKYTMPKPCWAILKFMISPGEPGAGIAYESKVSVDKIASKYQNEIENTIAFALKQGIKGWEVTDLKITLVNGEDHEVHSRSGDFALATSMAIMDGLTNTDTELLEPMFDFEIKASDELLGSIASDLTTMRGTFANPVFDSGKFTLKGKMPVATSMDYSIKLNSITSGKGKIKQSFGGYQKCTNKQGVIRDYKGVNPLDRSQWILHKRGAFK